MAKKRDVSIMQSGLNPREITDKSDDEADAEVISSVLNEDGSHAVVLGADAEHVPQNVLHDPLSAIRPEEAQRGWFQRGAIMFRILLASNTSNYNWPIPQQPYEEIIAWSMMPYLEIGAGLYYVANTHWTEIFGRLRAEARNNAWYGSFILPGKIMLATMVPMSIGLCKGMIQNALDEKIKQSPTLQLILAPPISRIIAATLALPPYMLGWWCINKLFPTTPYRYTQNAPLHPLQKIMGLLVRTFDSVSVFKFSTNLYRYFGPNEHLHSEHFTLGVGIIDQALYLVDLVGVGKPLPHPNVQRAAIVDPAAIYDRYNVGHGPLFANQPAPTRSTLKFAWYSGRVLFCIGLVALANFIFSRFQRDKEVLAEPYYTMYLMAICLIGIAGGFGFQLGLPILIENIREGAPRLRDNIQHAVTNCVGSFFRRDHATEAPPTEQTHLLEDQKEPASSHPNIN